MKPLIFFILVFLLLVPVSFAADDYKPYLHKATVPESPKVRLFGQYQTSLFPGAATYSYSIEVPKGTNGLQPSVILSYNSQAVKQRSSFLGAGWSVSQNLIYRDVNGTLDNTSDDKFILLLDGNIYELIFNDNKWHTEVEYHFRIENISSYWLLTKKDGTKYRFGYNSDSRLDSNTGRDYLLKWSLDLVTDTHGNNIYYSYLEDPFAEDSGAVYLDKIEYDNDKSRVVQFTYEDSLRPDRRFVYEQGNKLEESRRLTDISVFADDSLLRRYHLEYSTLNTALSSLSRITYFGADNSSVLHNISFEYYTSEEGYQKLTNYIPPALFSNDAHLDYGVRLIDFNNDGFVDIVQRKQSGDNKAWANNKNTNWTLDNSWTVPLDIVDSSGTDEGIRFADVNKDGFTDLLKSKAGTRSVYLNNWTGWNLSSYSIPIDFVDASGNDLGVQLEDVNGDGKIDLVRGYSGTKEVYLNNGSGWSLSSWVLPTDFISSGDTGARLIDINGDGTPDILKAKDASRSAWLNNGSGWISNGNWTPPLDFVTSSKPDNGVRFADINGDGLVDLHVDFANATSSTIGAWINNGSGWVQDDNWKSPEAFTKDGYNIGRRQADINGDGFADIIVSHQDSSQQYSWVENSTIPYLLKKIVNEYGGVTYINYSTSTQFNNSEDGTSDIGFNIFVVSNVTSDNAMTNTSFNVSTSTAYNYSFGKYNYEKNEFRGFGKVIETLPSKIVNHYFYQDSPRRGKEYTSEIYNLNGNIYAKNVNDYNWTISGGIYNLSLLFSTNYLYDGVLANPKVTNKSFAYDCYENLLSVYDYGDVSVSGDEKTTNYSYAIHTGNWIMDRPASVTLYDSDGDKVKDTKYYYDNLGLRGMGSKGELTKTERWNNNGNNSFSYFEYDTYGNIIKETDSLGNSQKYSYDTTHTYPDSTTNALGHISYYDYNLGTGNLNWQEKNGIKTYFYYDTFGRISKEVQPYDTTDLPTKSYAYNFDGAAPESIKVSLKTTADNTNDITYFYDGIANLIQLKSDIENNKQIVKNIFYDNSYRVAFEQNPYFSEATSELSNVSTIADYTYYSYDPVDRVIGVRNPDGTSKNVTFDHYEITDFDENGNKHKYTLDGLGRIVKVNEYNTNDVGLNETYITSYDYDTNDNLIKITDTLGNEFKFTYDSLGRKTAMDDPDLGHWAYSYDTNGNLITQTDARGESITLSYDALNRIKSKVYNDNGTTYTNTFNYDTTYYGTLTNQTFHNNITFSYTYDDRLRITKESQLVDGETIDTDYIYDSQNRLISQDTFSDIDYIFNKQGFVQKIPGRIADSKYNPFGSVLNKTYDNGLITDYAYSTANNRLLSITIPAIQNLSYSYDNVGNILGITDAITSKNHILEYDNLDRLVQATISSDVYKYSFNPTGNMMKITKNNQSKKFVYNGNQAHFPSKIIEGEAGINVYNPSEIETNSKNRTFEFFLQNEKEEALTGVNFTVNFGDGNSFIADNLTVDSSVWAFVQNNYSHGGDYAVNISAQSLSTGDEESISTKFGTRAESVSRINSNISNHIFEFIMHNDVSEMVFNISWNCSDGIVSIYSANLTGNQSLYDYIQHNYTLPGEKTFTCTVTSLDGSESQTLEFTIKGLEIENYDILATDVSKRVISYDVANYFTPIETNISMISEGESSSRLANLSSNENVMVFVETNYSTDGIKSFSTTAASSNYSTDYTETFKTEGVSIQNYDRQNSNYTKNIISFDVVNNWHDGEVNWSLNEPDISNSTYLNNNETLMVIIEDDAAQQGDGRAEVTAKVSSFIDALKNAFEIKPLKILSLSTLSEGTNAVSEMVVKNNLNSNQQFSWNFDTGINNVSSSSLINISSSEVFVYIESNYSDNGVYKTSAFVNSTSYNDTQSGVIVG